MARCPDCNRFVSYEEQDPEVDDPIIDDAGHVTVSVRIVNACQDCGTELTEATLDLETDVEVTGHEGAGHDLEIVEQESERTSRVEGKGRGLRTYYGATVRFTVKCECGALDLEAEVSDDIQASAMDVLV